MNVLMMEMIGLLLGTLLTGVLLTLGISSLFLLSSNGGDRNLLRRNHFLRVYIIILLSTVVVFDAEGFVLVNSSIIISQPLDMLQKFLGMWAKVVGITSMVSVLLADGVLVRLS